MSTGTWFIIIVLVAFGYFATQWGSSRGPGSVKKDILNLLLFVGVCLALFFMISGAHVAVVGR